MSIYLAIFLVVFFTCVLFLNIWNIGKRGSMTSKNVLSMLCSTVGLALIAADALSHLHHL